MTSTITQGDKRSLRRIIRKHIVRSDRDFGMLRTEYIERVEVDDMAVDLVEWADRRALRTAPAPAPSVMPKAAVEAAASAVRKERAFSAAVAFGVPMDDVPQCAEMIARAGLTAALPFLTVAPSVVSYAAGLGDRIAALSARLAAVGFPACMCHPGDDDSERCLPRPQDWRAEIERAALSSTTLTAAPSATRDEVARAVRSVTDHWDEPLDEVHDVPPIADALLARFNITPKEDL